MSDFIVHYELEGYVFETTVTTCASHAAIFWVHRAFPTATNIYVVTSTKRD